MSVSKGRIHQLSLHYRPPAFKKSMSALIHLIIDVSFMNIFRIHRLELVYHACPLLKSAPRSSQIRGGLRFLHRLVILAIATTFVFVIAQLHIIREAFQENKPRMYGQVQLPPPPAQAH